MNPTTLSGDAIEGLRPFQRQTVERAWASLFGGQGTGRFLVADEVGLGKTRVAAALIRELDELHRRKRGGRVVVYFAPNAEVARQNLRVLRLRTPTREPPSRLTLLALALADVRRPGTHVLGFTPGTSLSEMRGTGQVRERALLLALLRPLWRCGTADAVVDVLRDRAGRSRFYREYQRVDEAELHTPIADAFHRALVRQPQHKAEFFRLKRVAEREGELPKSENRARRRLVGELLRLLARASLRGLRARFVICDEFQRYPGVLANAADPKRLEHALMQDTPVLLLSATPYRMTADEQDAGSHVELTQLLRFLFADEESATAADHLLDQLRRSFRLLRPADDSEHDDSVERLRGAKQRVEQTLAPVMSRWQRPHDDTATQPLSLKLQPDDIAAYLAFQRVVDIAAAATGLRHRMTVEYWKSAPYLMTFMRGYRVKQAVEEAWGDTTHRRAMQRALRQSAGTILPLRDIERYRPISVTNARYRELAGIALDHDQWRALWVPPTLAPYAPDGPFSRAAAGGATKTLVFSGWRVVPTAVTALLGYEAERRSGRGAKNTRQARTRRNSQQLLGLRHDSAKGLQRSSVLALVYPSLALAEAIDPYTLARSNGSLPSSREVVAHARQTTTRLARSLRDHQRTNRADRRWYWAAPMLLDQERGIDVIDLLRRTDGLRAAWTTQSDETRHSEALEVALELAEQVLSGEEALGRQPRDLPLILGQLAVAGPAVTALRALARDGCDPEVQLASARIGWGVRSLLNRGDATLIARTARRKGRKGDAGAYWRDALDYCVHGALQGVMDEYIRLLLDEQERPDLTHSALAEKVADAFTATTDLQPLAVAADEPRSDSQVISRRRLTSRFAVAFGSARTEEDAGVHPEVVRQAFNSPFWPWVLVTTSVGQEGLDFHRYCHQLVHWNVPATPVELEQREGRVIRFFSHAVRRNIAARHGIEGRAAPDPWSAMLRSARASAADRSGFAPEWVYEGPARVRRIAPMLPYSRDQVRLARVQRARVYYRLVLGQPNPQELVEVVMANIPVDLARRLIEDGLALDLRPKPPSNHTTDSESPAG